DRAREPFQKQALIAAEHVPHERCEPPIVDRTLDPIGLGRVAAHVDPEIHEEALAEPSLLLQVSVRPEDTQAHELDGHAVILPRSTAAATASASTVSRTSCARMIVAPCTKAATAAPSDAARPPVFADGSPVIFPSVLFLDTPTTTG